MGLGGDRAAQPLACYIGTVALLSDVWVRYGSSVRGDRSPYGFGEWLFRRPPRSLR